MLPWRRVCSWRICAGLTLLRELYPFQVRRDLGVSLDPAAPNPFGKVND